MDVTKVELPVELINIIRHIANSHFVAIDLEFSGITGRQKRGAQQGKPTLQEIYHETKEAARKYQVLQIGLTIVEEDETRGMEGSETLS